jgi:carbamoyl-phosphate synthase large subunit
MKLLLTGAGGSASENFLNAIKLDKELAPFTIGIDSSKYHIKLSSADQTFVVPRAKSPEYLRTVNRYIDEFKIDVIHAQPDIEVMELGKNRSHLNAKIFLPPQEEIDLAADKFKLNLVMNRAGIQTPVSIDGDSEEDFFENLTAMLKVVPKVWIRAKTGAGSKASLPVSSAGQGISWIMWWIEERNMDWTDFQCSEFLPGKEFALQTIWQNGVMKAAEARERVEYLYGFLSPSGQSSTPSVARSTSDSEVFGIGISAIKALSSKPDGVYCVDMKTDFDGKIKVTEINTGRFFTTSNFFAHAGVNMPAMSIRAALGENLDITNPGSVPEGTYWIRMVDMGYKLVSERDI